MQFSLTEDQVRWEKGTNQGQREKVRTRLHFKAAFIVPIITQGNYRTREPKLVLNLTAWEPGKI